jgi:hypothetical protein
LASLSTASAASASSASAASASAASASAASAASASSAAAASRTSSAVNGSSQSGSGTRSGGPSGTGGSSSLSPGSGSSSFPHWAIAVIVVLGFLAIVALGILTFLIMRRMRRRNASANSMESSSPMMAGVRGEQGAQSPLLARRELASPTTAAAAGAGVGAAAGAAAGAGGGGALERSYSANRGAGSIAHDGASTVSDSGPFSVADAAIMADAFRQALRNADFAGRPVEEGESPEQQQPTDKDSVGDLAMNRELADEGRDIRDVGSSRGVTVRTLSGHEDGGDTVTDHTHTS